MPAAKPLPLTAGRRRQWQAELTLFSGQDTLSISVDWKQHGIDLMLKRALLAALATFCSSTSYSRTAYAELITSASSVPSTAQAIDFSQFFATGQVIVKKNAPIEIDQIADESVLLRIISDSANAYLLGQHGIVYPDNNFYLSGNGQWGPERNGFLSANGGLDGRVVMRIEFLTEPVSFVGGLFNYPPDNPLFLPVYMSALNQKLAVIERHTIDVEAPVSTPSEVGTGEFRGIAIGTNEIYALEINAPYAVIDDIRFSRVPEPDATVLFAAGLMAIGQFRRAGRRIH